MRFFFFDAVSIGYLILLLGSGVYFTAALRGLQFTRFFYALKETLFSKGTEGEKSVSPFQAACAALAGTLGTGNLAGVATAIASGGPGALFWMELSALFGMALKYAEILLAIRYQKQNKNGELVGGPMLYIKDGLHKPKRAAFFSLACIAASFGIGNLAQSNTVAESFQLTFMTPKWLTGLWMTVLLYTVICGGVKRIGKVAEAVIPLITVVYLAGCAVILAVFAPKLPQTVSLIWKSAFSFEALSGGIFGFLTSKALRYGISRGIFSNEAGLGSAPIIHGASNASHPVKQALWGITEVFLDTTVMCTCTGLVILLTVGPNSGEDGMALTLSAFQTVFQDKAAVFLSVVSAILAFASMIGWYYYGEKASESLFSGKTGKKVYAFLFLTAAFFGTLMQGETIWEWADVFNLLMAAPNCISVFALRKEVFMVTKAYFDDIRTKKKEKKRI